MMVKSTWEEDVDVNSILEKGGMPISEEYRVFVYAGKVHIVDN